MVYDSKTRQDLHGQLKEEKASRTRAESSAKASLDEKDRTIANLELELRAAKQQVCKRLVAFLICSYSIGQDAPSGDAGVWR